MRQRTRQITHAAILGALYFTLTHAQNLLLPGSATWAIQCRLSEALCVFSLLTPAAIPGLTIGCALFNLSYAGALPLDFLVGTLATYIACQTMWLMRNSFFRPLALLMPALTNAILVGWELTVYLGDTGFTAAAFWVNAAYVAAGELIVMLGPGNLLLHLLRRRFPDGFQFYSLR